MASGIIVPLWFFFVKFKGELTMDGLKYEQDMIMNDVEDVH